MDSASSRGERLRFALEASEAFAVAGTRLGQHFDRDIAIALGIPRAVDLSHAPCAEESDDFVGTETTAGGEAHGCTGQTYVADAST